MMVCTSKFYTPRNIARYMIKKKSPCIFTFIYTYEISLPSSLDRFSSRQAVYNLYAVFIFRGSIFEGLLARRRHGRRLYTYIRYKCVQDNNIHIGVRLCVGGYTCFMLL